MESKHMAGKGPKAIRGMARGQQRPYALESDSDLAFDHTTLGRKSGCRMFAQYLELLANSDEGGV